MKNMLDFTLASLDEKAIVDQRIRDIFLLFGREPGSHWAENREYEIEPDTNSISTIWNEGGCRNILRIDEDGLGFVRIADSDADIPGDHFTLVLEPSKLNDINEVEDFSSKISI